MSDTISRQAAIDAIENAFDRETILNRFVRKIAISAVRKLPSAQPEIKDEQAILHLQTSGWMQTHDKEMSEMGLREKLADDSDSYDALLPSAQPEQKWIPCSERLPEHGGRYLISVLDGINRRTTVAPYLPRCKAWAMNGRMAYWKVIAWMPLPEPAKLGGD